MKKFLKNNLFFFGLIFVPISFIILALSSYIPGPKITNSYSYNEKMKFIVERNIQEPQLIAVGSSITFNNLNSNVVLEEFKTNSYLNLSSWGLRMNDSYLLTTQLLPTLKPNTVIMMSSPVDFYGSTIKYNSKNIKDFVDDKNLLKYHYKFFDSKYFMKRLVTNYINFNTNDIYKSLNYDRFGGVMLNGQNLVINELRWNQQVGFEYIWPAQYYYLDSITSFLSENGIELIFIQSPIRAGLVNDFFIQNIKKHKHKVDSILFKNSQNSMIDCIDTIWSDNLFVDFQHLNETGAKEITKYWTRKYFKDKMHLQ